MGREQFIRGGINVLVSTLTANTGTVVFSNSNGVSFGMQALVDSTALTASAPGLLANAIQAISAGTTQATSGQVVFSNSNGIVFGVNGQTLTAGFSNFSYWDNDLPCINNGPIIRAASTVNLSVQRVFIPAPLTATRADFLAALSVLGSTAGSYTLSLGFFTMSGSSAVLASSASVNVTFNSGTTATAASIYAGQSGTRWRSIPLASWSVTPGEYLVGILGSVTGDITTPTFSLFGASAVQGDSHVTRDVFAYGYYSVAVVAMPNSIHVSDVILNFSTNSISLTAGPIGVQPFFALAGTF